MIGVVIARVRDGADGVREAAVDSWLMSCRVLGRKVEEAMLQILLERAVAVGAARIAAQYRPTTKNAMVRDLLDRLGFTLVGEDPSGVRDYRLMVADARSVTLPMRITQAAGWGDRSPI